MATIAMMVGGALVNALAFSGSNFLFSKLRDDHAAEIQEERKRHDLAIENLQKAQAEYAKKRLQRIDFINEQLKRENHAVQTFNDVDAAMKEYYLLTGKRLEPLNKPTLAQYYTPSKGQMNRELGFIVLGIAATALVAKQLN